MTLTQGYPYGLPYVQVFKLNEDGVAMGTATDPDSPTNGTTYAPHMLAGVMNFDFNVPDRTSHDFHDQDGVWGGTDFPPDTAPSGSMELETADTTLKVMIEGSKIDTTTIAGLTVHGSNIMKPSTNYLAFLVSREKQDRSSGSDSDPYWENTFYLLKASHKNPGRQYRGVRNANIPLVGKQMAQWVNGIAFGTSLTYHNNQTYEHIVDKCAAPYSVATFIADGTATTFTLPYLPTSEVVTAATAPNFMAINGSEVAPASISATTGLVTLSAAGSAGDVVSILYQTNFVASS